MTEKAEAELLLASEEIQRAKVAECGESLGDVKNTPAAALFMTSQ